MTEGQKPISQNIVIAEKPNIHAMLGFFVASFHISAMLTYRPW